MRHGSLITALVFCLAGCPGGDGGIGDPCSTHSDCSSRLQCVASTCVPRCDRAPDCGDGYRCDDSGICIAATGQNGDTCSSEVDCAAGLSCQIDGADVGSDGYLLASCVDQNGGRPAGAECKSNGECRNGTCDLGHCIDLCSADRDCGTGTLCTQIPRLIGFEKLQAKYRGCLQAHGSVMWSIPIHSVTEDVELPVPGSARSVSIFFTVDDPNQKVGATTLFPPFLECTQDPGKPCDVLSVFDYYENAWTRHRPELGESMLTMPISPSPNVQLRTGVYKMKVRSLRQGAGGTTPLPGTSTPTATAVIKVDDAAILDLHFYFLNLDDHPCGSAFGGKLDATTAQVAGFFEEYLGEIKNILGTAVYFEVGNVTFEDLHHPDHPELDHPDLDGLEVENAPSLLALGKHSTGINVFFVRTLSPIGLQAIGPNPGPAGLGGTRRSGIVIGVDTLCYRSWSELARLTAHELARYMGLYDNRGLEVDQIDPIPDSDDTSSNLMFYSELGGNFLSEGQKQILRRSAVLR